MGTASPRIYFNNYIHLVETIRLLPPSPSSSFSKPPRGVVYSFAELAEKVVLTFMPQKKVLLKWGE